MCSMVSAGMAADKHAMSAAQAEALGMLSPAAGVAAMERLLRGATAGLAAGVRGVAAPGYWRLLLQGVKHKPAMFSAVLDSADEVCISPSTSRICESPKALLSGPCVCLRAVPHLIKYLDTYAQNKI